MVLKFNNLIKEKSPLAFVKKFQISKCEDDLEFQYSKYVNGKPGSGITQSRTISSFSNVGVLFRCFDKEIANLNSDEEIAIHSIVKRNDKTFHLPLIDFSSSSSKDLFEHLSLLQEEFNYDIYIFYSGRSFHAYMDTLLTIDEWHRFLGKLLLLNNRKLSITDTRWIGHSIRQGYSSLRLSCNTPAYNDYPQYIDVLKKRK